MRGNRAAFVLQAVLGLLLLLKALILPVPIPPNTGFTRAMSEPWLEQSRHWERQVALLEADTSRSPVWTVFHEQTLRQARLARIYFFTGGGIGLLLFGTSFFHLRKRDPFAEDAAPTRRKRPGLGTKIAMYLCAVAFLSFALLAFLSGQMDKLAIHLPLAIITLVYAGWIDVRPQAS